VPDRGPAPPATAEARLLTLRDGRKLAYAEYGDPNGRPVFYFHGFPNSRLNAALGNDAALRHRLRVIAFDRPGFGRSDFKRGRTIAGWVDDIVEAADQLAIDRFAVVALSGGGPYAAACAARIPERLTGVALVSALAPFDATAAVRGYPLFSRLVIRLWRWLPWLVRPGLWVIARRARRDAIGLVRRASKGAPPADKEILSRPEVLEAFARDVAESFRQGSRGAAHEFELYLKPWNVDLASIAMEVHLWQGEDDRVVPPTMGRYYTRALTNARPRFYPGEGHLLIVDRIDEINGALFPPPGA
jgi:pimeloyl-ACP methyl ester carboxylesterase